MEAATFAEIQDPFLERVSRIVWATVTTVDRKGRPRSRILHPLWEGSTGWIATGRQSFKSKHIANNPYVSVSYWDQEHQQVHAECRADWEEDAGEKRRLWQLYKETPPPLGYDLGLFWPAGPEDRTLGLLKLTPWRIELWSLQDMMQGKPPTIWRNPALA